MILDCIWKARILELGEVWSLYISLLINWLIFKSISTRQFILHREVRESDLLYVHIYIFPAIVSFTGLFFVFFFVGRAQGSIEYK